MASASTPLLEALNAPGCSIFHAEPRRFFLQEIRISATTTSTATPTSPADALSAPTQGPLLEVPSSSRVAGTPSSSSVNLPGISSVATSASNQQQQPKPCPPAWRDPSQASRGLGRLRPRSAEFGARAKEALLDLGRVGKEKRMTMQKAHAIDAPNDFKDPEAPQRTSLQVLPTSSLETVTPCITTLRNIFVLKTDTSKEQMGKMAISAKREEKVGQGQQRWTKITRHMPVFVCDDEPKLGSGFSTSNHFENSQRAGTFSADLDTTAYAASEDMYDSESSDGGIAEDDEIGEYHSILDPSRLLLQVEPPSVQKSLEVNRVERQIKLQARLRVPMTTTTQIQTRAADGSPQISRRRLSNSHAPLGPREPRDLGETATSSTNSQIVFVSASSSRKLLDALNATTCKGSRGGFVGPLASPQAAKLEGMGFAQVDDKCDRAGDVHLDWTWSDLSRTATAAGLRKCACAFVELDEKRRQPHILASFAFLINLPAEVTQGPSKRTPSRDRDSHLSHPKKGQGVEKFATEKFNDDRRALEFGSGAFDISRTSPDPAKKFKNPGSGRLSSSQKASDSSSTAVPQAVRLNVDHIEIKLEDATEDSPILRAAVQNLDRRTAALKRASKAVLKAAFDVRSQMLALQSVDAALKHHLDDLASLMPDTVGLLSQEIYNTAKERDASYRQQELDAVDRYVVGPMQVLVEMCRAAQEQSKAFEAESKAYYSATQKWLSSRAEGGSDYADKAAQKQDRLDEKQRIRQARFDLARLDIFRSAYTLHGGEAELELASQMLALCRWYAYFPESECGQSWPTEAARSMLTSFEASAKLEEANVKRGIDHIREHEEALEARLGPAQDAKVEGETNGGAGGSWDLVTARSADAEPARQPPAQRIRTILSSIARHSAANTAATTSVPATGSALAPSVTNESLDMADDADAAESPTKGASSHNVRRKLSLKIQPLSNNPGVTSSPVLNRLQQKLRPGYHGPVSGEYGLNSSPDPKTTSSAASSKFERENQQSTPLHRSTRPRVSSMNPSASSPPLQQQQQESSDPTRRPATTRRSLSLSANGPSSPKLMMNGSYFDLLANMISSSPPNAPGGASTTATTDRHSVGAMSRTSSDSHHIHRAPPSPGAPPFLQLTTVASAKKPVLASVDMNRPGIKPKQTPGRKKEGTLWAMSKPITMGGSGVGDVPRGINRSSHWRECWVVLSGSGHLGEYAEWRDPKVLEPSQPLIDLRFATVREARGIERRFTFEVVTRDSRRFFQAPDEATMREWIAAISMAIESLINGTSSVRQIEKVARVSPHPESDFGVTRGLIPESGILVNNESLEALGQHRAFSQSLTDLSSASNVGPVRLFAKGVEGVRGSKRDSKNGSTPVSGHLATLSEGRGPTVSTPTKPWLHGASKHERGISNKTPLWGYVNGDSQPDLFASSSAAMTPNSSSSHNFNTHLRNSSSDAAMEASSINHGGLEHDRKIEAIIQSSYGGISGGSGGDGGSAVSGLGLTAPSFSSVHKRSSTVASTASCASGYAIRSKESRAAEITHLAQLPGNATCADCGRLDPRWASWMLHSRPCCIFICIACSGIHRGLGVQISKVKSVDLDDWTEDQIQAASAWGNVRVNSLYEALKPKHVHPGPTRDKSFWTEKYVNRSWYQEAGEKGAEQGSHEASKSRNEYDGGYDDIGDDDSDDDDDDVNHGDKEGFIDDDDDDDDGYQEHEVTFTPTETGLRKDFSRSVPSTRPIGISRQSTGMMPYVQKDDRDTLQQCESVPPSRLSPHSAHSAQMSPPMSFSPTPSFQERMGVFEKPQQRPISSSQSHHNGAPPSRSPSLAASAATAPFVTMLDAPRQGWASGPSSSASSNGVRSPYRSPIDSGPTSTPPVSSSAFRQFSPRLTKVPSLESSPPSRSSKRLSLPSPSLASTFRKTSESMSSSSAKFSMPRMSSSSRSSSTSSSMSTSYGLVFPTKEEQSRQAASSGIVSVDIPTLSPTLG